MQEDYYYDDPEVDEYVAVPRRRRVVTVLLSILALVATGFVARTTLAANIGINIGGSNEFGQGSAATVSCAGSNVVTLTPQTSFTNTGSGSGSFKVSAITLSNIPSGCNGADLLIRGYDSTTSTALSLFDTTTADLLVHSDAGTFRSTGPGAGLTITNPSSGTFKVTFAVPAALSTTSAKFTVQSSTFSPNYQLGSIGPGGGIVFYYSPTGFLENGAFVHYLELAPANWQGAGSDPSKIWAITANQSTSLGTTSSAIGAGYANTLAIVNQGNDSTTAAGKADGITVNGKSDWFLPSMNELNELCKYAWGQPSISEATLCTNTSGSFNSTLSASFQLLNTYSYWSSTEKDATNAYGFGIYNAFTIFNPKSTPYQVRAIRAFYN